jgi:hypothetical protein
MAAALKLRATANPAPERKAVVFKETAKGYIAEVNGKVKWFIQKSQTNYNKFWVCEEVDGNGGFLLREVVDTLQTAKSFVYNKELKERI